LAKSEPKTPENTPKTHHKHPNPTPHTPNQTVFSQKITAVAPWGLPKSAKNGFLGLPEGQKAMPKNRASAE
jgi:hypothetical protein